MACNPSGMSDRASESYVPEFANNNFTSEVAAKFVLVTPTSGIEIQNEALRTGTYWYRYMPELHIPEHWQQFPPRSDTEHEILGFAIVFLAFLSFCGNGCVMYVFTRFLAALDDFLLAHARRTKILRTPSNALIVNLALSDFLMMLTQCPIYVTNSFHHRWALPAFWCPFMAFTGGMFGIASIMSMAVIAIDRYLVICRPFFMLRSQMSRDRAQWAIGFVWLYSLGWSLPPLFGYSRYVPEGFMTTCSFDYLDDSFTSRSFIFAMAVGVYFVPLTTVTACYILILRAVRRSEQKFSRKSRDMRNASGGSMHKERASRKKETEKVIFFVIVCWAASWTPYLVVSFMGIFFWRDALTPWTSQAPALFAKTASVYNPLVYAISHPKYRAAVRRHFPFLVCFPTKADTDEASEAATGKSFSASARLVGTSSTNNVQSTNYSSVGVGMAAVRLTHGNISDVKSSARTEKSNCEMVDMDGRHRLSVDGKQQQRLARCVENVVIPY